MFYLCKRGITLLLLLFAGIYCNDETDEGDVPGYGIYKVFISSKKDLDLLNDLANSKVIYPIKKTAFNWKVLVRANHEHYFQRRLIENKINYIVIQTNHDETLESFRANIGPFDGQNQNQDQGQRQLFFYNTNPNTGAQKCFPTNPNCIPDNPPMCFPTSPNCIPPFQMNPYPSYFPEDPRSNINQNVLPPGNYFYCYLTGGCVLLPPPPPPYPYPYHPNPMQMQQKSNNQSPPSTDKYPKYEKVRPINPNNG